MSTDHGSPQGPATKDVLDEAVAYVVENRDGLRVDEIGQLCLPAGGPESGRCRQIMAIMEEYAARTRVSSPLSIAVFGPPGSGKSYCVEQIAAAVPGCQKPQLVNLSQLASPEKLNEALKTPPASADGNTTRVIFFDEFDTALDDVPLGWLRWFLAPMQDGTCFVNGEAVSIGKTIFMFAGGTASTLDEFDERARTDPATYRSQKVPDFISRLRGFIDIHGINNFDADRPVRRALVLHRLLDKRWPGQRDEHTGHFPIDPKTVRSLLSGVHFVHGARSMEALLDMSRITGNGSARQVELPAEDIMKVHLNRGPLDGHVIGISAGQQDHGTGTFLKALTHALFQRGAALAYGGDYLPTGTLHAVVEAAKRVPDELVSRTDKRIRNYLGFPTFANPKLKSQFETEKTHVDFIKLLTIAGAERTALGLGDDDTFFSAHPLSSSERYDPARHVAWALSLFRMRVRLVQDISAMIVLGGKDDGGSWGRFAGIAEEVLLALALRKPVYVLGGYGGAARPVGRLLALDDTLPNATHCLVEVNNPAFTEALNEYAHCFTLPGYPELPRSLTDVRQFLFDHSVHTPHWPWNGLTAVQNRRLFTCTVEASPAHVREAVDLILQGLLRLDWNENTTKEKRAC